MDSGLRRTLSNSLAGLIVLPSAPPLNNPPQWDTQPTANFVFGTASNVDMNTLSSDPDSDPITFTMNTGSVSLPVGVTWTPATGILAYDGVGAITSTSGHIITLNDGTDPTASNAFGIVISASVGFPLLASMTIGAGGQASKWSQTAEGSMTAIIASHDIAIVNYIEAIDNATVKKTGADQIRLFNPDIYLGEYKDPRELIAGDTVHDTHLRNNFSKTGTGGAVNGDGLGREVDGLVEPSFSGKTADVNPTDYYDTVDTSGRFPVEYMMQQRWLESFDTDTNINYDFIYWDIGNWHKRFEEKDQDWNRDGTASANDFDGTTGTQGPTTTRIKRKGYDRVNTLNTTAWSKNLEHIWNGGSWFDWFDGANADTGPTVLLASSQPTDLVNLAQGVQSENWGKLMGFEPGSSASTTVASLDRASGSFARGFKQITRMRDWMQVSPLTSTKILVPQFELNRNVATAVKFQVARYLTAVATIAGTYCAWEDLDSHRASALLDEYVAGDVDNMTVTQIRTNKHWLGVGVGAFPVYGGTFSQGVRGGIIANGVYGMEFASGFVFVNPKGNGSQTITVPTGSWTKFTGVQSASVNDGSALGTTLVMGDTTGLFVKKV